MTFLLQPHNISSGSWVIVVIVILDELEMLYMKNRAGREA